MASRGRNASVRAGVCCALAALAAAPGAAAFERQQNLGVQAGATFLGTQGAGTAPGLDLGLHYTYGLSDAFLFVVEADASAFFPGTRPKNPPPEPGVVTTGGVGVMYIFDVLRWVPYAGAIVGAGYLGGGFLGSGVATPDAQLAVGVDYEISRSWAVGAAYRQHFFLTQMNEYPEMTTVGVRLQYVWGW
jgi:opacity protein-like surface antigen